MNNLLETPSFENTDNQADKDLLFLAGVHGNETFSFGPLERLSQQFSDRFDWLKGNPRAIKKGVRYTEADMNRNAPGDPNSPVYEVARASEVMRLAKQYRTVIDIHGAPCDCGIFALVTNPTLYNLALAASLPIQDVMIWVSLDEHRKRQGPFTIFLDNAVTIECGDKNRPEIASQLQVILAEFLENRGSILTALRQPKDVFCISGPLEETNETRGLDIIDKQEMTYQGETFTPVLARQYPGIACYKAAPLKLVEMLGYGDDISH